MKYYSTNNHLRPVDLSHAVLRCFAPDGGVYMPDSIPLFPKAIFRNISQMSLKEIGYIVATSMFGSDIPAEKLNDIVQQTLSFDIPLVKIDRQLYALELFHGPSGTFKDIGARFLARIIDHFISSGSGILPQNARPDGVSNKVNVFVATSGNTEAAVSDAFAGFDNINVFILHPDSEHMRTPEKNIQNRGSNIHSLALRGTFEDCQRLAKEIYSDELLNRQLLITSANSVNIARLLPQVIFFFHAYARLLERNEVPEQIVISTPCGNLGNLTAALFAKQMGLPVNRILASGYGEERLWGTISHTGLLNLNEFNAKALSTNLARINHLLRINPSLPSMIDCHTFNDKSVAEELAYAETTYGYSLNRNSAMACRAVRLNKKPDETAIFLATTDPARLPEQLHNGPRIKAARGRRGFRRQNDLILPPAISIVRDHIMNIASDQRPTNQ